MLIVDDDDGMTNKWVVQSSLTFKLKTNTKYQARFAFWNSTFMCIEDSLPLLTPSPLAIEPVLPLQIIHCPESILYTSLSFIPPI